MVFFFFSWLKILCHQDQVLDHKYWINLIPVALWPFTLKLYWLRVMSYLGKIRINCCLTWCYFYELPLWYLLLGEKMEYIITRDSWIKHIIAMSSLQVSADVESFFVYAAATALNCKWNIWRNDFFFFFFFFKSNECGENIWYLWNGFWICMISSPTKSCRHMLGFANIFIWRSCV